MKYKLKTKRRKKEWWIVDTPPYYVEDEGPFYEYGPYDTKEEVEESCKCVQKTLDHMEQSGGYKKQRIKKKPKKVKAKKEEFLW